jgi:hypothetical protein
MKFALLFSAIVVSAATLARHLERRLVSLSQDIARAVIGAMQP